MSLASQLIITGDVADFLVLISKVLESSAFIQFFGEEPVKLIQEQLQKVGIGLMICPLRLPCKVLFMVVLYAVLHCYLFTGQV